VCVRTNNGRRGWWWQTHSFAKLALSEKFHVRLSVTTERLLRDFLQSHSLLTILQILHEHVSIQVKDCPPRTKFEPAFLGTDIHGSHTLGVLNFSPDPDAWLRGRL
jgi:hypothetical protein